MDARLAKIIAPAVKEIEDNWGIPLTDLQKLCVLGGFAYGIGQQHERTGELVELCKAHGDTEKDDLGN